MSSSAYRARLSKALFFYGFDGLVVSGLDFGVLRGITIGMSGK